MQPLSRTMKIAVMIGARPSLPFVPANAANSLSSNILVQENSSPCSIKVAHLSSSCTLVGGSPTPVRQTIPQKLHSSADCFLGATLYILPSVGRGLRTSRPAHDAATAFPAQLVAAGSSSRLFVDERARQALLVLSFHYSVEGNLFVNCRVASLCTLLGGGSVLLSGCAGLTQLTAASSASKPAVVAVNPATVPFGSVNIGSTSAAQNIVVSNQGNSSLILNGITARAPFAVTSQPSLPLTLSPGGTASISVVFQPSALGTFTGTLTVASNAKMGTSSVSLSGTGAGLAAILSPSTLSFPSQLVNSTSAPMSVTLSNPGAASLSIAAISTTGNFQQSNNCGAQLAAGANCSLS